MEIEKDKIGRKARAVIMAEADIDAAFARAQRKATKAELRAKIDAIVAKRPGVAMKIVHVRCRFCGHRGSAAIPRAAKITDRLVCSSCGSRNICHQRDAAEAPELEIEAA